MNYDLPQDLEVCGVSYPIRSDHRAALDICAALSDPELTPPRKVWDALFICYPTFETMPPEHHEEALRQCFWFLNGGEEEAAQTGPARKLVDWERDFPRIVAPVNRIIGQDIRSVRYLHWWTFLAAYMEIGGDCLFAQIVRIRDLKARGKTLDKFDREWYRRNRHLVDIGARYTGEEMDLLAQWT